MCRLRAAVTLAAALALCGCGAAYHPEWVIRFSVEIVGPAPAGGFRLLFPYIVGDLYGSPGTGDFVVRESLPGHRFALDLNRTQDDLERELGRTDFGLRFLHIVPTQARLARLTPIALQASGIETVGTADWIDARTRRPLMLVYVDRPARIAGAVTRNGQTLRYDIRANTPGYIWVGGRRAGANEVLYSAVPAPRRLVLVVTTEKRLP